MCSLFWLCLIRFDYSHISSIHGFSDFRCLNLLTAFDPALGPRPWSSITPRQARGHKHCCTKRWAQLRGDRIAFQRRQTSSNIHAQASRMRSYQNYIAKAICGDATDGSYPILWYYRTGGVPITCREKHVTIDLTSIVLLPTRTVIAFSSSLYRFLPTTPTIRSNVKSTSELDLHMISLRSIPDLAWLCVHLSDFIVGTISKKRYR